MSKRIEYLSGEKIGELEYVADIPIYKVKGKSIRDGMFKCRCGNVFKARIHHVKSGNIVSCKCVMKDKLRIATLKHGCSHGKNKTKEYHCWINIKTRCYNKNYKEYHYYGGRGIFICDYWLNSFDNFLKDMGVAPSKTHSIERKNNDLGYFKENCYWATKKEQVLNRRNMKFYEYKGVSKHICEWAEVYSIPRKALWKRLVIYKWSVEKSLTTPIKKV